jgi:hypothetical protein
MALTVEDGTGVAGADSYVDLTVAAALLTNHLDAGLVATWSALSTAVRENALRRGAQFLDGTYRWLGDRAFRDQGRAWPRVDVDLGSDDGLEWDHTIIPHEIKLAQALIAQRITSGTVLVPDLGTRDSDVTELSVAVGSIKRTQVFGSSSGRRDRFPEITLIVSPYTQSGANIRIMLA